jgi:dienelactone hydrolase
LSGSSEDSMRRSITAFLARQVLALGTLLMIGGTLLPAKASDRGQGTDLPRAGQIGEVVCGSDHGQSYALYVPSGYTAAKRWPIVYFFDPAGRGRRPLELYKNIAEKYGFIFAGSNNSRNFSSDQSASVNSIWRDTHDRLSLDERRVYSSGFSGGARVAGAMALSCPQCQMAGIIAHGAGYPSSRADPNDKLLYFFAVGNRDFNWPEVVTVRREREAHGQPYRVRVFDGSHQWAPVEVMEDAIQWLILKAMQQAVMSPDPAFVDRQFQLIQSELEVARKKGDAIGQLSAYHSLVSDFGGLKSGDEFAKNLAVLKQSDALKRALKSEQAEIDEQFALEREISPKLRNYTEGKTDDPNALRLEIVRAMSGLRDQAAHARTERKRLIYGRAFDDIWVEGIENGQQALEARHWETADSCFELMAQVSDNAWPHVLLAQTHAASGKSKQAIRDLQQAVRRGWKDREALESDVRLSVLHSDADFQKIFAELDRP